MDHGAHNRSFCTEGTVFLIPTPGIGATNGILQGSGITLRIRQVPGPHNQGSPLSDANGMFVRVCGNFVFDDGQVLLNVTSVEPRLLQ